jgi:hypothetical protein
MLALDVRHGNEPPALLPEDVVGDTAAKSGEPEGLHSPG